MTPGCRPGDLALRKRRGKKSKAGSQVAEKAVGWWGPHILKWKSLDTSKKRPQKFKVQQPQGGPPPRGRLWAELILHHRRRGSPEVPLRRGRHARPPGAPRRARNFGRCEESIEIFPSGKLQLGVHEICPQLQKKTEKSSQKTARSWGHCSGQ